MTAIEVVGGRPLRGRVRVPGDKSISHRALLLGALADGESHVTGLSDGDDVRRTAQAVRALGVTVDGETIAGGIDRLRESDGPIDVGNSGTSIRLLAGLCANLPFLTILTGDASIQSRPMDRVAVPLRLMGAFVDGRDHGRLAPLAIRGGSINGIDYTVPMASAQVKSAILLAGLGATSETIVREKSPTRAHTEEMLAACGADIQTDGNVTRLSPSALKPFDLAVPGDPSQAAFWIVAACIVPGSEIVVEGVYVGPARTAFIDVLRRMGAAIDVDGNDIAARYAPLHGTEVGGEEIPALLDEIPALAVAAAVAEGVTVFRDAAELVVKESNRIATMVSELGALGARAEPLPDGLIVPGGGRVRGGRVQSHGDHRVAMAMAVAALASNEPVHIDGWEAVLTSYPGFEATMRQLCA